MNPCQLGSLSRLLKPLDTLVLYMGRSLRLHPEASPPTSLTVEATLSLGSPLTRALRAASLAREGLEATIVDCDEKVAPAADSAS